jgi:hypothetical protein
MESIKAMVSSKQFLKNLMRLKGKMRSPLPSDVIHYQCKNCDLDLPLNCEGVIQISSPVEKNIGIIIDEMIQCLIGSHTKEKETCSSMVCIHPYGTPENILLSFPESDQLYMTNFKISNDIYKLKLMVTPEASNDKAICVLYQKESVDEVTYSQFIECNFNTHLNIEGIIKEGMEEEIIYDDESVNYYQHNLPRISGGGRTLDADYNYECIWCPKEVIRLGKKGRFRQFKSYREHFKAFHHGEDGDGVPMADFLERVHRLDPKWFCRVCARHYSLGNVVYHKSVCKQPEEDFSESESDGEGLESIAGPSNQKSNIGGHKKNRKKLCIYDDSSSDEKEPDETEPDETEQVNKHFIDKNIHSTNADNSNTKEGIDKTEKQSKDPKRSVIDESFDSLEENNEKSKCKTKKKVKLVNTDYSFLDVEDELYSSSPEMNIGDTTLEPKIETTEEPEFEIEINVAPEALKNKETINKWWLKVPKHLYGDRSLGGPNIFLPEDSQEFVKRCTDRYKKHIQEKKVLDQKMKEAESEDAQLLQFSMERDKPILEKYTDFVKTSSAKDVLKIFSEEYEQLDLPIGAKSSTAGQYKNRIIEFFKFMARLYHNFHLDWMIDFKGKIEKTYPDGSKTNDIFLPTKEDFTEFIKQYKYGG